jgi:hypothetical protein
MRWWIRAYLGFAAFQGLGIGLTGLFLPAEMQIPLRLTPLNARFVAALYVAGGIGVLWAAFAKRKEETRLFVLAFAIATAMILVLTLLHWSDFMGDGLPHRAVWIFVYVADPLLGPLVIVAAGLVAGHGRRHSLSTILIVEAAIFGVLGIALLFAPEAVATRWPWNLPPLVGQLYACFFLTFAIGAAFAARETQRKAISGFLVSSLALVALALLASVLHVDRFKPEPVTWVWFGALAMGVVAFSLALRSARSLKTT